MREAVAPEALVDLLSKPAPRPYLVGGLPGAPADTLTWVERLTLADAISCHRKAIADWEESYTRGHGDAEILRRGLHVNPAQWRLGSVPPGAEPEPGELEPLFDSAEEVERRFDPGVGGAGQDLLRSLQDALGFGHSVEPSFDDYLAYRRHLQSPGRWVAGLFAADPEVALWVRPFGEDERAEAWDEARTMLDTDTHVLNQALMLPSLLVRVVSAEPGGHPLLTGAHARRLPYGAAMGLYAASYALTYPGVAGEVRFRHEPDGDGGRGGDADLVQPEAPRLPAAAPPGDIAPPPGGQHGALCADGGGHPSPAGRAEPEAAGVGA